MKGTPFVRGIYEKGLGTMKQLVASFLFHYFRNRKNFRLDEEEMVLVNYGNGVALIDFLWIRY
ncbi:hypothetical protein EN45_025690 [Penicillium chrysogenum]|uniref:Uncharacterized protein n=1 Tax=Penicillium chrysogenum TaxID=5076 RepID=A0A167X4R7_PENCH|nr:hypothetical protein EN45_025690 [Penicillium chrysogenum]